MIFIVIIVWMVGGITGTKVAHSLIYGGCPRRILGYNCHRERCDHRASAVLEARSIMA